MNEEPSAPPLIRSQPHPGVWLLQLNRPERLNALNKALLQALRDTLREAAGDMQVRCVVLTGGSKAFCVGADIREYADRGLDAYLDPERLEAWSTIEVFSKPIIAAVNGYAIGGGLELAMLCDIIVCGHSATFAQGEIGIGSFPGDGGTQRLPRLVGKSLAMQMILTGDPVSADHALKAGLVSEAVPAEKTLERALGIAQRVADQSATATQLAKQAVLSAYDLPLAQGLKRERELVSATFNTRDRAEGLSAFLEKRKPRFNVQQDAP